MKIAFGRLQQIIKEEVSGFLQREFAGDGAATDSKSLQDDMRKLMALVRSKANQMDSNAQKELQTHIQAALAVMGAQ